MTVCNLQVIQQQTQGHKGEGTLQPERRRLQTKLQIDASPYLLIGGQLPAMKHRAVGQGRAASDLAEPVYMVAVGTLYK